jgi:DNA-binding SARP family transcriptional activator/tetratricopeptide (TPR) repeat protein
MGRHGQANVPPGRQQIILGTLLLDANRVVRTDRLIDAVWDESPPATARSQIQMCVSSLRRSLAELDGETRIVTKYPGYLMRVAEDELDLQVFERKLAEADGAEPAGAVVLIREALALWRGDALGGGCGSRQLAASARRLDERWLTALENCIGLELRLGRHHELTPELTGLVEAHPLRERLRGQLMLALYRSGRQAKALEIYRDGRAVLAEELGLEPGAELRKLEGVILAGDPRPGHAYASPEQTSPEQASAEQPLTGDRPSVGQIVRPRQLPAGTVDFTGRAEHVEQVVAWLTEHTEAVHVVAISGMPGVGKSALAVRVAHQVAGKFHDGQLYADLRGTQQQPAELGDVLGRFLRALGIPGLAIPGEEQERAEMYRSILADRSALVVLEDAASEAQVMPLLPGGDACAVIVTSRSRLTGLPGVRLCDVEVMDQGQGLELLGKMIGKDRIAAEPVAADALVSTVGGLPLALRVVAARLAARSHWTLASMMTRLADERHRLDELRHGEMMVRASLALSYEGLHDRARRLLRLLSMVDHETFPGWIAAALLDEEPACGSPLMDQLVDAQMLDVAGTDVAGCPRYRFHNLIRLFARERLAEAEEPAVRAEAVDRLVGGWLAIAQNAHRRIYGGDFTILHGNGRRWHVDERYLAAALADPMRWLESEQANLVSAVTQAAAAGLDESCWDLAVTAVTLFESRGYFDDWQATHEVALDAVRRAGNSRGVGAVMCSLGSMHLSRRSLAQARLVLEPALTLFDELSDTHGRAMVCRTLGLLAYVEGRLERAGDFYQRALDGFQAVDDRIGEAYVLGRIAQIDIGHRRYDLALYRLNRALETCRETGNARLESQLLYRVGRVLLLQDEYRRAEEMFGHVLAMVRSSGDVLGESFTLHSLGVVYTHLREPDKAEPPLRHALWLREHLLDQFGAARVRLDLATLLMRKGAVREAEEMASQALRTFTDRRLPVWEQTAEAVLAELAGYVRTE